MKLEDLFDGDMSQLMEQAKRMQQQVQEAQARAQEREVVGEAGGGLVKVTANGRPEVLAVEFDDALLGEDREMLQDLIVAATNDALGKSREAMGAELGPLASAMDPSAVDPSAMGGGGGGG